MSGPAVRSHSHADPAVNGKARSKRARVKFGAITVVVPKLSAAEVRQKAADSSEALERTVKRLSTPGVRLGAKKNVPRYSADPTRPGLFVRVLNGKRERGVLVDGAFKVVD